MTFIIIYTAYSILVLVLVYWLELTEGKIEKYNGVIGLYIFFFTAFPILALNNFFVWNFFECKTNEEINNRNK